MPAARSLAIDALPIGLAKDVVLTRDAAAGTVLTAGDVSVMTDTLVETLRTETKAMVVEEG